MINNEKFKAVGIIGNPLNQSLSPYLHNYWIKKYGLSSAFCSSKSSKLIVLPSSLGGVPVFNLAIVKLNFFNCSLKPLSDLHHVYPQASFHFQYELRHLKKFL